MAVAFCGPDYLAAFRMGDANSHHIPERLIQGSAFLTHLLPLPKDACSSSDCVMSSAPRGLPRVVSGPSAGGQTLGQQVRAAQALLRGWGWVKKSTRWTSTCIRFNENWGSARALVLQYIFAWGGKVAEGKLLSYGCSDYEVQQFVDRSLWKNAEALLLPAAMS